MDAATKVRVLRRLVYTDKILTYEAACRYLELAGIPRAALDDARPLDREQERAR